MYKFIWFLPDFVNMNALPLLARACGVRPSVCLSLSCILSTRVNISLVFSPSHQFFLCQVSCHYSDGDPPNNSIKCRWGMKRWRFRPVYRFIACCERWTVRCYKHCRRTVASWWHLSVEFVYSTRVSRALRYYCGHCRAMLCDRD